MFFFALILLAVSLSMDALGIGISYAVGGIKTPFKAKLVICLVSILITAIAVSFGNILLMFISEKVAKIVGALMLIALGCFIILQAFFGKDKDLNKNVKKEGTIAELALKSLGISIKIIRNPIVCDFDNSRCIDMFEALYLGIALSIDSFGVGVSSSVSGLNSFFVPIAVGVFQLLFLCFGEFLGKKIKKISNLNPKIFVILSGFILIVLAVLRCF